MHRFSGRALKGYSWFHANFLAKRKGATNCVDLVPKYFFAESEIVGTRKISCVSCVKLDPGMFNNPSSSFCSHKFYLDEWCGCVCGVLYINDFTLAANPKNIGGCSLCYENIMHPAGGGYHGAQPRSVRHAPGGLQISFKFWMLEMVESSITMLI